MKNSIFFTALMMCSLINQAQNVSIPDPNFKNELVSNSSINTNLDSEISFAEAVAVNGLVVDSANISDLTGIEAFVNISWLDCSYNNLTNLDLTSNSFLEIIFAEGNQIATLDINNLVQLTNLSINNNLLSSINLSTNINLTNISVAQNSLSSIDLSNNLRLYDLSVFNNPLTSLNLTANDSLGMFTCANTLIDSIDLSQNINLWIIGVSDNVNLNYLNIKNGLLWGLLYLNATNNPNLSCIEVDDVGIANTRDNNGWIKDASAVYSTDCSTISIEENINKKYEMQIYPNPTNNLVTVQLAELPSNGMVNIKDVLGKTLLQQKITSINTEINVNHLPKGIYYVELVDDSYQYAKKLVVN